MNGITFIRKIDDLGRIVIPKELRGKLKLSENENILLKLTDNKIEIQKYSYINNYQALINGIISMLCKNFHFTKCLLKNATAQSLIFFIVSSPFW